MIRTLIIWWLRDCFGSARKGDNLSYTEIETEAGPNVKILSQRKDYWKDTINPALVKTWKRRLSEIEGITLHGFHVGSERVFYGANTTKEGQCLLLTVELIYREKSK